MKKLLLLTLFLGFCITGFSQKPLTYTEVVRLDDTTLKQAELYARARAWFNTIFKSSKDVLNIQDKESGELAGNGSIRFSSSTMWGSASTKGYISFKISVYVKDGRYKYEFTDFQHTGTKTESLELSFGLITDDEECPYSLPRQTKKWENKLWLELKSDIASHVNDMKNSLNKAMNKPSEIW